MAVKAVFIAANKHLDPAIPELVVARANTVILDR
jgi:hypothetical protein